MLALVTGLSVRAQDLPESASLDQKAEQAAAAAKEALEEAGDAVGEAVEEAGGEVTEAAGDLSEAAESIGEKAEEAAAEAGGELNEAAEEVQEKAEGVKDDAAAVVEEAVAGAGEAAGETAEKVEDRVGQLQSDAKEAAGELATGVSSTVDEAKEAAGDVIEGVKKETAGVVESVRDNAGAAMEDAAEQLDTIQEKAEAEITGTVEAARDVVEEVSQSAANAPDPGADEQPDTAGTADEADQDQTAVVTEGIDEKINNFIGPVTDAFEAFIFWPIRLESASSIGMQWIDGGLTLRVPMGDTAPVSFPFVLVWLLGAGIWATLYFGFPSIRLFPLAIKTVRGKYTDAGGEGEVSHFKALTTALSATVGLGNIAGVAVAISIGGPGATFWMILAGLVGMSSKFVECTLGVKFRQIDENGKVHGGPMYYLSEGFRRMGLGEIGTLLGGIFALMCIGGAMGGGNIFQINSATDQIINFTVNKGMIDSAFWEGNRWLIGLGFALIVGLVILGGLVWIANVTSFIVPFMCGIYVLSAITIIFMNFGEIPKAVMSILGGVINPNPEVVTGGIIGALIAGFQRAAFSNEAGIGSAPIAHSGVRTRHPASEGVVALLEPFIDTVVVCTMTALVIIIALGEPPYFDADGNVLQGITLTTAAFKKNFEWMGAILTLSAVLFAFSTMISWCYYGMQSWTFLFGKSSIARLIYKFIFLSFVIIGSAMSLGKVTAFSDAMIFAMAFPNVFAIVLFSRMVRDELRLYLNHVWDRDRGITTAPDQSEGDSPADSGQSAPNS